MLCSTLPNGTPAWPPSQDPKSDPAGAMQLGHAALCTSGRQCEGTVTSEALDDVVADFIGFAAGVLAEARS